MHASSRPRLATRIEAYPAEIYGFPGMQTRSSVRSCRLPIGAGMSNSVVSWLLALGNHSQRLEAASAAGEHVSRLGLDPVWEIVPSAVRSKSESASWGMTPYFTSQV